MHYYRDKNFAGLLAIATSIEAEPSLQGYAAYCRLREQGLRQRAFDQLDTFIADVTAWEFEARRAFVDWLMTVKYNNPQIYDLIPHPLEQREIVTRFETTASPQPVVSRWQTWLQEEGLLAEVQSIRNQL